VVNRSTSQSAIAQVQRKEALSDRYAMLLVVGPWQVGADRHPRRRKVDKDPPSLAAQGAPVAAQQEQHVLAR